MSAEEGPFLALCAPDLPLQAAAAGLAALGAAPWAARAPAEPGREQILAPNAAARAAGVFAGQSLPRALARCPALRLAPRAPRRERAWAAALARAAAAAAPRLQAAPPDAVVLDLAGLRRLRRAADAPDLAARVGRELVARCAAFGLHLHAGLAARPALALLAAKSARLDPDAAPLAPPDPRCPDAANCPAPLRHLPPGAEAPRLAALPLALMAELGELAAPAPAPEQTAALLDLFARWGVTRWGELAALPASALRQRLGPAGLALRRLARGEVEGLLAPAPPPRDLILRRREFEPPLADLEALRAALAAELEPLGRVWERRDQTLDVLEVVLALAPQRRRLAQSPGEDSSRNPSPVRAAAPEMRWFRRFPAPTRDVPGLLARLDLHWAAHPPPAPVRALRLRARLAPPRRVQPRLFAAAVADPAQIARVLEQVAELAGGGDRVGSPRLLDSRQPGAFALAPFAPPDEAAPSPRSAAAPPPDDSPDASRNVSPSRDDTPNASRDDTPRASPDDTPDASSETGGVALRRYRPPLPAHLRAPAANPAPAPGTLLHSSAGAARILRAAGPWRSGGAWWRGETWLWDEWDIEAAPVAAPSKAAPVAALPADNNDAGAAPPDAARTGLFRLRHDLHADLWTLVGRYD